ncbi:hypothetical protein [Pseudodesulfovibrio sp.]|uniref:hypothetical protein n=1 Tax=Pseudodesulfovibrio sp. TaxID=2035812 RepID=UPI002639EF91|nr:hypothetical protein [Pseudodesulfovibrio sp.]MDD3311220.1 hypothetical protein [Pseudodesulfovibrio sp.]
MIRTTGKTQTLIALLLLALCLAPVAGFGQALDQPLNRGTDAARFAPAILGGDAGTADRVERTRAPEASPVPDALLPGTVLFRPVVTDSPAATDLGASPAASGRARSIPIRAPPRLPL